MKASSDVTAQETFDKTNQHFENRVRTDAAPQLQVDWTDNGNMTLTYGHLEVFGWMPTTYDTPAVGSWNVATKTWTTNV